MKTRGRPRHPDVLTPREWEVLTLVREGLTNPQIAERMGIALDTAKSHVSEIISKLQVSTREEAAAWRPEPAPAPVMRPSWANALGGWWPSFARLAGAGAMVAAVAGLGVIAYGVMRGEGEEDLPNDAIAAEPTTTPSEAEVTELLNDFLAARIAGEGAEQYLNSLYPEISAEDVPLLYATSSGVPYERGEFEPVTGIEWPYGFRAFNVRLFAGDTVVEQLYFVPHDDSEYFPADGRLGLEYQPHGFATEIAPTRENGQPVALPYNYFDLGVTLRGGHPWVFGDGGMNIRLIPEGPGVVPTTDGGQREDWDVISLMADPAPVEVAGSCQVGPSPGNARALAESIRSFPLEATAPVAVSARGAEGLMMDVKIEAGAIVCGLADAEGNFLDNVLKPVFDQDAPSLTHDGLITGVATGEWMRLYLFDMPEGSPMRLLAIAIVAPQSRFQRAVEAAAPVVDSLEIAPP
jgi:DNA-binding CsgD family transcriptional regulator